MNNYLIYISYKSLIINGFLALQKCCENVAFPLRFRCVLAICCAFVKMAKKKAQRFCLLRLFCNV